MGAPLSCRGGYRKGPPERGLRRRASRAWMGARRSRAKPDMLCRRCRVPRCGAGLDGGARSAGLRLAGRHRACPGASIDPRSLASQGGRPAVGHHLAVISICRYTDGVSTPLGQAADLLRTLGDETRLQMLALLRRREFCVCELVALFPISQPAVSGHLRRLKDAGLVEDDRRGMWVYYRACAAIPALVGAVLAEVALPPHLEAALALPDPAECGDAPAAARPQTRTGQTPVPRRPPARRA